RRGFRVAHARGRVNLRCGRGDRLHGPERRVERPGRHARRVLERNRRSTMRIFRRVSGEKPSRVRNASEGEMMLRLIKGTALAFIATAAVAAQPEPGDGAGLLATLGQIVLLLIVVTASVAVCLLVAWGIVRVLVHVLVRIGLLPKKEDRSGRW